MKITQKPKLSHSFQSIVSQDDSTLLVIDHQTAFASCFEAESVKLSERAVSFLICAAETLEVPTISSVVATNHIHSGFSPLIDRISGSIQCFGRNVTNPWDDPEFCAAVVTANRPKLILAGLSAESSLSLTALCALEQGFDVFVVRDACLGFSPETLEASFERLKQAGAVIVSWRQVMAEWHQGSLDAGWIRRVLKPRRNTFRKTVGLE